MAQISIEKVTDETFRVKVTEGSTATTHEVTARSSEIASLGGADDPERLIAESFEFLLEREPKESILRSFELGVIGRYFPEYPSEIRERLNDR